MFELWKERLENLCECGWLIGEREQEIDAAHLRIAKMIAWLVALSIVPLDPVFLEMRKRRFSNLRRQVLLCMLDGQAEGTGSAFVNAI